MPVPDPEPYVHKISSVECQLAELVCVTSNPSLYTFKSLGPRKLCTYMLLKYFERRTR